MDRVLETRGCGTCSCVGNYYWSERERLSIHYCEDRMMAIYAFKDSGDGYYETDIPEGQPMPEWTAGLMPCAVQPRVNIWSPDPLINVVRSARNICLDRLMGIAFAADKSGDAATVAACLTARTELLNITTAPGVTTATDDAGLKAALVSAYAAIVGAAPESLRNAFADFNL